MDNLLLLPYVFDLAVLLVNLVGGWVGGWVFGWVGPLLYRDSPQSPRLGLGDWGLGTGLVNIYSTLPTSLSTLN